MCKYLHKFPAEIYKLTEVERTWLLLHVLQDEKERYEMFDTLIKCVRPEILLGEKRKENISETSDEVLLEDIKQNYPNLSEEETQEILKNLKEGITPIDNIEVGEIVE